MSRNKTWPEKDHEPGASSFNPKIKMRCIQPTTCVRKGLEGWHGKNIGMLVGPWIARALVPPHLVLVPSQECRREKKSASFAREAGRPSRPDFLVWCNNATKKVRSSINLTSGHLVIYSKYIRWPNTRYSLASPCIPYRMEWLWLEYLPWSLCERQRALTKGGSSPATPWGYLRHQMGGHRLRDSSRTYQRARAEWVSDLRWSTGWYPRGPHNPVPE